MKLKYVFVAAVCALSMVAPMMPAVQTTVSAANAAVNLNIDGKNANTKASKLYRGQGMVSANNSSRLLLDYKTENPEKYWQLLNYIFGDNGIGISHLKIEMGADINSSSGTEPSVKRTENETADVTRGAGYQLAADAKTINPNLTLDMLGWSEPKWVSSATDVYAARYKWFDETLSAAYKTYGIKFDYVSANQNERASDNNWIKYLSTHLKSDKDCPYDYSKIKIVAGEEVCTWNMASQMLKDKELMNAIDVLGSHYTSWSTDDAKTLSDTYGKELWFSEGCSPMSYSAGTYKYDGKNSGLTDINGMLDIANRMITMYPEGDMTLYEYQPVIASYYDGACYCQKQLITANEAWSGAYTLDSGFYMSLHFSQFIKKGWAFVDNACHADGEAGGDGHAVVDAKYSYITATDTNSGDYSTVITNTTAEPTTYNFTVSNLAKASSNAYVWETRGPDGNGSYDENYYKKVSTVTPKNTNGKYVYSVTVKPYSMVTVSTVDNKNTKSTYTNSASQSLSLPYNDDYEYSGYSSDYLSSRGNAPRYTTDEGGAFEVQKVNGNNVLMQMITADIKSKEWGSTPNPTTNFGDDHWYNYSVSAKVMFEKSSDASSNYVGVGLRYNLAANGASGYWIKLYENGTINLMKGNKVLAEGKTTAQTASSNTVLKIQALQDNVTAYINGKQVLSYKCKTETLQSAGRAALYSSYNKNSFDNIACEPISNADSFVKRFDNTDSLFTYSGTWSHNTMSSFKDYKRTISTGNAGSTCSFTFTGTGFAVTGSSSSGTLLSITVDGKVVNSKLKTYSSSSREISYFKYGLSSGSHTVTIRVSKGKYSVDGLEVISGKSVDGEYAGNTECVHQYTAEIIKPTYTSKGYTLFTCTICGYSYKSNFTDMLVHTPLSKCKATLSATKYAYTGKSITPKVTVKLGELTLKKDVDYTVTYKSNKSIGKAYVTIKGKGKYTGTKLLSFSINPKKQTVVLKAYNNSFKASLKKDSQATGYQLEYSTTATFKSYKLSVLSKKTTSKTIKKLKDKKYYFVRTRTYKTIGKTNYYGAWSTIKKVKTK